MIIVLTYIGEGREGLIGSEGQVGINGSFSIRRYDTGRMGLH